jgi:hypothetical protein
MLKQLNLDVNRTDLKTIWDEDQTLATIFFCFGANGGLDSFGSLSSRSDATVTYVFSFMNSKKTLGNLETLT